MASFSVFDNWVNFQFACLNCGVTVDREIIDTPEPNMHAENSADSERFEGDIIVCPNVYASIDGRFLEI